MQVTPSGKGGGEEDEVLTHPRRQPMGEHLFPRAGHLENAADLALSLGVGSILQNPPTSCSLQRGKSKGRRVRSSICVRRGFLVQGMHLWDCAHLGTSHSGSLMLAAPGITCPH